MPSTRPVCHKYFWI